ncbi:MAG: hypothetical protein KC421_30570 [Anaerolineales bacterium]|nr:hypothetical protein [Anaerolineales bacterium]
MRSSQRYPYVAANSELGEASLRPFLPFTLTHQGTSIEAVGLLDTGAMVNVLPWQLGIDLGTVWEEQTNSLHLTGNLAQYEARVLLVVAEIGSFEPVRLAFAWTQAENVPLLLGQVNFFMEFDACFYRSQLAFDLSPKNTSA